jgi:hypothetical protein
VQEEEEEEEEEQYEEEFELEEDEDLDADLEVDASTDQHTRLSAVSKPNYTVLHFTVLVALQQQYPSALYPTHTATTTDDMMIIRSDDNDDKPAWPTWAIGVLSGMQKVETFLSSGDHNLFKKWSAKL